MLGLGVFGNGDVLKGNAKLIGDRLQVGVVAENERDLSLKLPGFVSPEQVEQAVVLVADPDRQAGHIVRKVQLPGRAEGLGDRPKGRPNDLPGKVKPL